MNNEPPKIVRFSLAACLLMIGFAFFYRYVFFLPQLEKNKIADQTFQRISEIQRQADSENRLFNSNARAALLSFASISDRAGLMTLPKTISIADSIKEYEELDKLIDELKIRILQLNAPNGQMKVFINDFVVITESLRDSNKSALRYINYTLNHENSKAEVERLDRNLHYYDGKPWVFQNEVNAISKQLINARQDEQTKNQMSEDAFKQASTQSDALITGVFDFSNKYFPMFGIDAGVTYKLTIDEEKRIANKK